MNYKQLTGKVFQYRNKSYDIRQVVKICEQVVEEEKKAWTRRHDLYFVLATATILNADPFKFGKKRLYNFFELLFEQAKYLNEFPDDVTLLADTCLKIGLKFEHRNDKLCLYMPDELGGKGKVI